MNRRTDPERKTSSSGTEESQCSEFRERIWQQTSNSYTDGLTSGVGQGSLPTATFPSFADVFQNWESLLGGARTASPPPVRSSEAYGVCDKFSIGRSCSISVHVPFIFDSSVIRDGDLQIFVDRRRDDEMCFTKMDFQFSSSEKPHQTS